MTYLIVAEVIDNKITSYNIKNTLEAAQNNVSVLIGKGYVDAFYYADYDGTNLKYATVNGTNITWDTSQETTDDLINAKDIKCTSCDNYTTSVYSNGLKVEYDGEEYFVKCGNTTRTEIPLKVANLQLKASFTSADLTWYMDGVIVATVMTPTITPVTFANDTEIKEFLQKVSCYFQDCKQAEIYNKSLVDACTTIEQVNEIDVTANYPSNEITVGV